MIRYVIRINDALYAAEDQKLAVTTDIHQAALLQLDFANMFVAMLAHQTPTLKFEVVPVKVTLEVQC